MRLVLALLPAVLAACSTGPSATSTAVDPADLERIALRAGTSTEQSIPRGRSRTLEFILDVPAEAAGDVPLVIAMPYAGDSERAQDEYHRVLARPGLGGFGAVVVVPRVFDDRWTSQTAVDAVASFVEAAAEAWPVDPGRVVVTGYSDGGNGVWAQISARPDLYSAAVPMASVPPVPPPAGVPLYIVHGEGDELFSVAGARSAAVRVREAGGQVELETPAYSHFEAGRYVAVLARAVAWVQTEVWGEAPEGETPR